MFCNNCGEKIPEGTTKCPKCGEIVVEKSNLEQITKNVAQATATPAEVVNLADAFGCFGLLLICFNPLYWTGKGYLERAQAAAREGDVNLSNAMLKKGKKYTWLALLTSILFIALAIGGAVYYLKYEFGKKRDQKESRSSQVMAVAKAEKKVEADKVVMDVTSKTADKVKSAYAAHTASIGEAEEVGPKAATSSIRGEMRHGALGGYVLQLWNTIDQPLKCEAVLNNPKLRQPPKYLFVLQPNASKPQELGAGQFHGRRILTNPPCTVTVTVLATGETHTYRP